MLWLIRTADGVEREPAVADNLADGQLDADKVVAAWALQAGEEAGPECPDEEKAEKAAAAAYRVSVDQGNPLSERRLAAMFGRTSRRWARHRMAEARSLDSEHALVGNR